MGIWQYILKNADWYSGDETEEDKAARGAGKKAVEFLSGQLGSKGKPPKKDALDTTKDTLDATKDTLDKSNTTTEKNISTKETNGISIPSLSTNTSSSNIPISENINIKQSEPIIQGIEQKREEQPGGITGFIKGLGYGLIGKPMGVQDEKTPWTVYAGQVIPDVLRKGLSLPTSKEESYRLNTALKGYIESRQESQLQQEALGALERYVQENPSQGLSTLIGSVKQSARPLDALKSVSEVIKTRQQLDDSIKGRGVYLVDPASGKIQEAGRVESNAVTYRGLTPIERDVQKAQALSEVRLQEATQKEQMQQEKSIEKGLKEKLTDIGVINQDITNIKELYTNIPKNLTGPIQGRTFGSFEKIAQTNPDVALYEDLKQTTLANLSRTLGGEKGTLTDKDVERISGFFPKITDTQEVGQKKLDYIEKYVNTRIDEYNKKLTKEEKEDFSRMW